MMLSRIILVLAVVAFPLSATGLMVGSGAPQVILQGKNGGRVNGTAWNSDELRGKVHAVFYVDPDAQKLNEHVEQALKKEAFPRDRYASVAIVNMKATWIPNFLIAKRLKKKQDEFTSTTFVKDKNKLLVKEWGLTDNSYHVVAFDKNGNLLFSQGSKMSDEDVNKLISVIRSNL